MILPARAPLAPHHHPLRALYLSLNGPVVTLEGFASGPARAAVAVHAEGATLCVRSLRTGQTRFFTTARSLAGDRRVADAALSFAESMGFLFDEDEVEAHGGGAELAIARWQELCGEAPAPPVAAEPGAAAAGENLLDELWKAEADVLEAVAAVTPVPPVLLLSKFRRMPPAPAAGTVQGDLPDPRLRLMSRF